MQAGGFKKLRIYKPVWTNPYPRKKEHIPPNGKAGKSSTQSTFKRGYVLISGGYPFEPVFIMLLNFSDQIIATSHNRFPPKGSWEREIPLFQGNLGWSNIISWPDHYYHWWYVSDSSILERIILTWPMANLLNFWVGSSSGPGPRARAGMGPVGGPAGARVGP